MFGTRHRSTASMTPLADQCSFSGTSSPDTNPFKEKGRHKHLWNNFQGRLVYVYIYICSCSTTSTARTRTTKNNVSKLPRRSLLSQSNFDKANGASLDRVQKNMARRWLARRRLGPHCDKEAAGVRHCRPSNMRFVVHLRF